MPQTGPPKQAAAASPAQEGCADWLHRTLDALPVALAVLDAGGRLVHLNTQAQRVTGYRREDLGDLDHCLRLAFPDPAYQDWLRGQWQSALTRERHSLQAMITCAGGVIKHLRINKASLPGGLSLLWTLDVSDLLGQSPADEPPAERLASAFKETSLALVVSEMESGLLVEANQAFLALTGHRAEEVLGLTAMALGLWPDPEFRRQMVALVMAQGGMHGLPLELKRKDGQTIYVLCSAEIIVRQGKRCLLSTFVDLGQHHLVTRALREREEKFRTLTETAASGIFIIRGENICYINPAGERICGYSQAQLKHLPFWSLVHPDHRELVRERGLARQQGEVMPNHYEFKLLRPDGASLWVDFTAGNLIYQDQPAVLGTVYDITERKLTQEALRQSEERLRSLTENAPDIIFSLDRQGRFTYINPAWQRILGHLPEEVLGRHFVDLARPEDRNDYVKIFRQVRDQGRTVREHHGFLPLRGGGGKRNFLMSASPNLDGSGGVNGLVGLMKDVTQQEELEAQLRHAQKLEALGSLTGGVAHEFNNVLMTIRGYTQLLALAQGDARRCGELLAKIDRGCQRAADLTRKMLTFSRMEAGEKQQLNLNQVVEGVWQFMRQTAPPAIDLELNLAPDLPPIVGNASQLEQVLMNLAINARDAIAMNGRLSFSTRLVDLGHGPDANPWLGGGSFVQVEVADSGQGMPPEVMQRIFDPFFTTKEPGKGTGLGLSVVYSILKSHGGHIWVESDKGRGSRFSVYLPVTQAGPAAEPAAEPPARHPRGDGERVLVVDDEEHIREIVCEMLGAFGYRVGAAANGLEALKMCADAHGLRQPFELVIMDLAMPVMDGNECMGRLRELQPEVKVLVATGHGGEQAGISLQKHEPSGVLFKPYDLSQLLAGVRRALDGPGSD
ncbi:MAG: PAS domain S-box protein [Pseudomonadota bacterium]